MQVVGEARKVELLGETGVVCFKPQFFTVRTKRLTQLLRLDRTMFLKVIEGHTEDVKKIIRNFSEVYIYPHNIGIFFDHILSVFAYYIYIDIYKP